MTKLSEKLDMLFRYTVLILFGTFIGYLSLLSLFSTNYCFVGKTSIFVEDSPIKAIACYVLLVGLLILLKRYKVTAWLSERQQRLRLLGNLFLFLFLLFFVVSTQLHPHGDQLAISNAAVGLRKYDFSLFTNNSYFVYWPFQSRIVVFLWGFFKIFGNLNYLAFQVMNAVCIVITLNLVAKTTALTGFAGDEKKETVVFFSCMLFWPYLFYVTFIYGNVVGFTCIAAAVYFLLRYVQEHKTRYITGVIFLCATGVWLKNTYLIFMVAILIFLLVDFWQRRHYKSLIGIVCVPLAAALLGHASDALVERRLGFPLQEGTPMIAWVTMAFGQDENGRPVKFDAYNIDVYLDNGLDGQRASQAAAKELQRRLRTLTETPGGLRRFMGKKIAIAWNEPTFESLVANNRPQTQIEQSGLVRRLLQEDNRNPLVKFADLFHALVLLGALSWLFLKGGKESLFHLFFAVVFVGGFLFQLFWETYSQYTLIYFLLLIPYAVSGYLSAAEKVEGCIAGRKPDLRMAAGFAAALAVIALVGLLPMELFKDLFRLDDDTISYTQSLQEMDAAKLQSEGVLANGDYVVTPLSVENVCLASGEEEDENGMIQVTLEEPGNGAAGILRVYHEHDYDLLRFRSSQMLLSLSGNPADGEVQVGQDYDYTMWKIIEMPEMGYAIVYGGTHALTVENGALTVRPFAGGENQIWKFERSP